MEKPSNVQSDTQKEKGTTKLARSQRQRPPKVGRSSDAPTTRKDRLQKRRPETDQAEMEKGAEVQLKPTVVDIDSVRGDMVKEENLGLLEAAEQDDGEFVA